jgi:uncharacterized UBP type Zn finger protein
MPAFKLVCSCPHHTPSTLHIATTSHWQDKEQAAATTAKRTQSAKRTTKPKVQQPARTTQPASSTTAGTYTPSRTLSSPPSLHGQFARSGGTPHWQATTASVRPGLPNLGNTCYFNAALAALSTCTPLMVTLGQLYTTIRSTIDSPAPGVNHSLSTAIMRLYEVLRIVQSPNPETLRSTTEDRKRKLRNLTAALTSYSAVAGRKEDFFGYLHTPQVQFDSSEVLHQIVELITDVIDGTTPTTSTDVPLSVYKQFLKEGLCPETTSHVVCTNHPCEYNSPTPRLFDYIQEVNLPTIRAGEASPSLPVHLQTILQSHFTQNNEAVPDSTCPTCRTLGHVRKHATTQGLPQFLVVCIKRFRGAGYQKDTRCLDYSGSRTIELASTNGAVTTYDIVATTVRVLERLQSPDRGCKCSHCCGHS